jgi:osmotically-inducible protein OsmY
MSQVEKRAEPGHDRAARQTTQGARFMTNDELQAMVRDELFCDPRVDRDAIAVSANDGEVTL